MAHTTDAQRVREILCDSIERLFHGGRLLRDELDRLTIEELRGVLRTLVNAEQARLVENYLTPDTSHLTPQLQEAA
jgi:hypothetical protein